MSVEQTRKQYWEDGLLVIEYTLARGEAIEQHAHDFGHFSILARGAVLYNDVRITAPYCFHVKKGTRHGIVALEDCVWYCINKEE